MNFLIIKVPNLKTFCTIDFLHEACKNCNLHGVFICFKNAKTSKFSCHASAKVPLTNIN